MQELPQLWRSLSPTFLTFHTLRSFLTLAGRRTKDHSLSWGKKSLLISRRTMVYTGKPSQGCENCRYGDFVRGFSFIPPCGKRCVEAERSLRRSLARQGMVKAQYNDWRPIIDVCGTPPHLPLLFRRRLEHVGRICVTVYADNLLEEPRSHAIKEYRANGVSDLARRAEAIETPTTSFGIRAKALRDGYAEKYQFRSAIFPLRLIIFVPRPVGKSSLIQSSQLLALDLVSGPDSQVMLGSLWCKVSSSTTSFRQATCHASKA